MVAFCQSVLLKREWKMEMFVQEHNYSVRINCTFQNSNSMTQTHPSSGV